MNLVVPILAFGFSQIGMLWWLVAAAAPLVIHLLNRRRYKVVPWAAVEYLLAALQQRSWRIRFEQWLLLAIRTLLVVLLVLAVAGPYLDRLAGSFAAAEPIHKVIVLDGSYSMAYKPGERTRFELAKDLIRELIARSAQGDGFTLVLMSDPARAVVGTPAFVSDEARDALQRLKNPTSGDLTEAQRSVDEEGLLKELRDLKLPHGGGDLAGALAKVEEIVANAKRENPRLATTEIYFFTDLQRASWDLNTAAGGKRAREQLARLAGSARLAVADLGQEHCENLAVTILRALEPICTTHGPTNLRAEVRNFGSRPQHVNAELLVDGRRVQERAIDVAPRTQQSVSFAYRFESAGDHALEARLVGDPADLLDIDNHRWLIVPVKESVRALIVNGDGSPKDARFLATALDPYRDGSEPVPVQVAVVDGSLLQLDLRQFDCIFLSNVAQFAAGEPQALASYARAGGGLVFFLGDRVDPQYYNEQFGGSRPGQPRILPALLDRPSDVGQYSFDPLGYADPLLHEFKGNDNAGLLSTAITRYFRLKRPDPSAQVALAIRKTGDPAIVAARVAGDGPATGGRSILVALPASFASVDPLTREPWTNWPLKASFPPIVQSLLFAAIGPQGADRNGIVGRPLESSLPAAGAAAGLVLERPDGRKEQIRIATRDEAIRWSYPNTWQSGIYRTEFPSAAAANRMYAVNVDTTESDLAKLAPGELPPELIVFPGLADESQRPTPALGVQNGIERYFLVAVLALLLLETTLASVVRETNPHERHNFPTWLERLFGIPSDAAGEGTVWRLDNSWPLEAWVTLLGGIAIIVLIAAVYATDVGSAGRFRRAAMALLRLTAIGLLLVMIAGWVLRLNPSQLPYLVVIVDDSESMKIADHYDDADLRADIARCVKELGLDGVSRLNQAKTLLLENDAALLQALDGRYKLRVYFCSELARPQTGDLAELRTAIKRLDATGKSTRLGDSLRAILSDQGLSGVAAVVIFSDGITTDGEQLVGQPVARSGNAAGNSPAGSPSGPAAESSAAQSLAAEGGAADFARAKGIPLFTVGLGSGQPLKDIELADLRVPEVAFVDDILTFKFNLTSVGYAGKPLEVRLKNRQTGAVLDKQSVTLPPDHKPLELTLTYRPTEVGQYDFIVEADHLPDEVRYDNNQVERQVSVRKTQIRVLLVQAYPNYEFRYLKNLLERDSTIELKTLLQDADPEYA